MTFTGVLLICVGAIAACATLVFAVETLVAFFLQPENQEVPVLRPLVLIPGRVLKGVPSRRQDPNRRNAA